MKKIVMLLVLVASLHVAVRAQDEDNKEVKKGFDKQRLFTGGSVSATFSSYFTELGVAPQLGYTLTHWADVGITLNFDYTSERDYEIYGDKLRETVYGPGAFVRLFPVNFLFATAQYEYNFLHLNYIPAEGSGYTNYKSNTNASSLLLGAGYAGGRSRTSNTYYYLSISWDVLGDKNSPYIDSYGRSIPVIRAGYNIGLFQKRRKYERGNAY